MRHFTLALVALLVFTPAASRAQGAPPAPHPVATWAPEPVPTIPPDVHYAALQTQARNAIFGLLAPYCEAYGGFVNASLSGDASPYPVFVSCVKAKLRIDSVNKVAPLP